MRISYVISYNSLILFRIFPPEHRIQIQTQDDRTKEVPAGDELLVLQDSISNKIKSNSLSRLTLRIA